MLIDSYSQVRDFTGKDIYYVLNNINGWAKENNIIISNITIGNINMNNGDEYILLVTYNVKEQLNAVEEAARERMPKDIPYVPKGRIEGTRHH